ncbi:MAG TPA: hypothetical protein VF070_02585 [Streptosporangiaceae bacterium]
MGRPPGYQWRPLGLDTDPVPGDPQAISVEAAHLASIAKTIAGQVMAMHKIASDNTEKGQHADKIRSEALSLAGSLQVVAVRYQKVSSALSGWVPELEKAQALSIHALDEAEAPYARLNQSVTLPSGSNLTTAQKQEIAAHNASMRRAQDQLDAAKALLTRATSLRDTQAAYYAAKINQASNDSLADHESLWGDVTGFVGNVAHDINQGIREAAGTIKAACSLLEFAAVILAIAALCMTGVGWVLVAAIALTASALALRTLLAATGNGSWIDVAVDAFALATLGIGGGVTGLGGIVGRAGKTLDEAIGAGDRLVIAERAVSISGRTASRLTDVARAIQMVRLIPQALARPFIALAKFFSDVNNGLHPLASTMVKDAEESSAWARIFSGGEQPAKYVVQMRMLLARFPDSPEITQLGSKFTNEIWTLRGVVGSGTAVSAVGVLGNGIVQVPGPDGQPQQGYHIDIWDKLEDETTVPLAASIPAHTSPFAYVTSSVW